MLSGLIFATDDAHDYPNLLGATLPFGGATLIEFQARLLRAVGVSQLIIVVTRLTPELLGAVSRMTRRGLTADIVRSAAEAEAKLHPLARVLVVADGLVTTDRIMSILSEASGDALLVTGDEDALPGLERVGANAIWAGLAVVEAQRIADVAAKPRDYDFESTLLRVTAQSGAMHLPLPVGEARAGHGIERDSARLRARNDAVVTGYISNRISWVDRYVIGPVARRVLPLLIGRAVPGLAVGVSAAAGMIIGLGLIATGWSVIGLPIVILSIGALEAGSVLSWMRDEQNTAAAQRAAITAGSLAAMVLLGLATSRAEGTGSGLTIAVALAVIAALVERGASERIRKRWWVSPPALPLLLTPFVMLGQPLMGLWAGAIYAGASLALVIEALREKP